MKLALKITPQRSTQYANMTEKLAAPELLASPLGSAITHIEPATLAGQAYLLVDLDEVSVGTAGHAPLKGHTIPLLPVPRTGCASNKGNKAASTGHTVPQTASNKGPLHPSQPPSPLRTDMLDILSRLGATSEAYQYFEHIGEIEGPLLRPLEPTFTPFIPWEMAETRRYKGKTNEVFTRVLLNIAIFAGAYSQQFTARLRVLDPLAGGGTTLFLALAAGYDAFGIEQVRQDVETTAVFIRQYFNSEHIPYKELDERGRRAGRRYQFEVGHKGKTRMLVLVHGDTSQAPLHMQEVPGGPHMHAIVGDLPYGIQHFGEIADLLHAWLPAWERLLLPGGTLALAWNATHIERAAMVELLERRTHLQVRNDPPYTQLAHTVDRVIKKRDILVARHP